MNIEELREYCISKKGVTESLPFGPETLVFKVMDKVFLLTGIDDTPLQFNVKCDPERAEELCEEYECITPGYHMNKKHWITVTVDKILSRKQLQELIDHSYDLVAGSKKKSKK